MARQPKPIVLSILLLCVIMLVAAVFYLQTPDPVTARVLIQNDDSDENLSLLMPLSELFANEDILKDALLKLLTIPAETLPDRLTDLKNRVRIMEEKDSEIVRIIVSNPNRSQAAQEANAIVKAGQEYYLQRALTKQDSKIADLRRQLQVHQHNLDSFLEKKKIAEMKNISSTDTENISEGELRDKETRLSGLLETYTDQHPHVIELKKQITYLQQELLNVPQRPAGTNELQIIQGQYDTEMSFYQQIHDAINDTVIARGKIRSPIKMMSTASANTSNRRRNVSFGFAIILPILALIGLLLYYRCLKWRQEEENRKLDQTGL